MGFDGSRKGKIQRYREKMQVWELKEEVDETIEAIERKLGEIKDEVEERWRGGRRRK